jgi:hypothetical protein
MRLAQLPNINIINNIPSANNFDPLQPARYYNWMQYVSLLPTEKRIPWLRMMNVDRVEAVTDDLNGKYSTQSISGGDRFTFYPCSQMAFGPGDALEKTKNSINDNSALAVIENSEVFNGNCDLQSVNNISILFENATRMELSVQVNQAGWFMIADTWYPGWSVTIDGSAPEAIFPVNYVFRGFPLQAGKHSIVIVYRPWWVLPSIIGSFVGICTIIAFFIIGRKRVPR